MGRLRDLDGRRVYLDSNVFIYALNGFPGFAPFLRELFEAVDSCRVSAATSELTLAEVLIVPFRHGDVDEEKRCRMMLRPRPCLSLIPVSFNVLEATARMRAALPAMRTPDAIHVATAQLANCDILLTNDHRLKGCEGLHVSFLSDIVQA